MTLYNHPKAMIRIGPIEEAILATVDSAGRDQPISAAALKRYRLLIETLNRVAEWKARNERTKG